MKVNLQLYEYKLKDQICKTSHNYVTVICNWAPWQVLVILQLGSKVHKAFGSSSH